MTLTEVLTRRGIKFRVSPSDRNKVSLNCIFCTSRGKPEDAKMRLCIHTKDGWGRCLHCDWKSRFAIAPFLKYLGIADVVSGSGSPGELPKAEPVVLPKDFQCLSKVYDDLDREARRYILSRGVTKEQIKANNIGVSYAGRFAYRVLFPVYADGALVGISGRDFTGSRTPKYLLSKGDKYLYGFCPEASTVILSEGVIKALRISSVTPHCSSALFGHNLTEIQAEQLAKSSCEHVILYPDPDPVGRRGTAGIADKLIAASGGKRVSIVWPVTLPADDVPLQDLRELLENSVVPYNGSLRALMLLNKSLKK